MTLHWFTRSHSGIARWQWCLLAMAGIVVGVILQASDTMQPLDHVYSDAWHRQAGVRKVPRHVALVVIDDKALLTYRDDPVAFWTQHYAKAVATLRKAGAAIVGFDMILGVSPEAWIRRFAGNPEAARTWDAPFRRELNSGKLVLVAGRIEDDASATHRFFLPHEDYLFALPDLDFTGYVGLANLDASDRVIRHFSTALDLRLRPEDQNATLPRLTFSALLAVRAVGANPRAASWALGNRTVASSAVSIPLFYAGPPGTIPRVPLSALLAPDAENDDVVRNLRDKVVIIGGDWGSDLHATPYASSLTGQPAQFMIGAEIHANAVETLLSGQHNREATAVEIGAVMVAAIGLTALLALLLPWPWALAAFGAVWTALPTVSYAAFQAYVLLPVAASQMAMLLTLAVAPLLYWISESRERKLVRQLFGHHVSDAAVGRLVRQGALPNPDGDSTPVTVLILGIHDFTRLAGSFGARTLVNLLNAYFEGASQVIFSEGGTIDKFVGSTLIAEFGTPEHNPHHARAALHAAAKLHHHAQAFANHHKLLFSDHGLPAFHIGVAVHTGEAIVGNIGIRGDREFTIIGDVVEVASSVGRLTGVLDIAILATHECLAAAGDGIRVDDAGMHVVQGCATPLQVFSVNTIEDGLHDGSQNDNAIQGKTDYGGAVHGSTTRP